MEQVENNRAVSAIYHPNRTVFAGSLFKLSNKTAHGALTDAEKSEKMREKKREKKGEKNVLSTQKKERRENKINDATKHVQSVKLGLIEKRKQTASLGVSVVHQWKIGKGLEIRKEHVAWCLVNSMHTSLQFSFASKTALKQHAPSPPITSSNRKKKGKTKFKKKIE